MNKYFETAEFSLFSLFNLFAVHGNVYISLGIMGYGEVFKMGGKKKTSISLDEDLLSWIDEMVKTKRFANRTHAIEYALQRLKEGIESGERRVK